MKNLIPILIVLIFFGFTFQGDKNPDKWGNDTSLSTALMALGQDIPEHYLENIDSTKAHKGEMLIKKGFGISNSFKYEPINEFFRCVDCHNVTREDPDLKSNDPQARLEYVDEKNLPFLQGTTLWGAVNRTSYFNGDYEKLHSTVNINVGSNLKDAVQFCAGNYSKGRLLNELELEAVIHYLWTLEITLGDLDLSERDWRKINILSGSEVDRKDVIELLESKFLNKSEATFVDPPKSIGERYKVPTPGNVNNGEKIYESSCIYCHKEKGSAPLILKNNKCKKRMLRRHLKRDSDRNLYNIIRLGHDIEVAGDRFMPLYPLEKMSNQQVEDLRAFIEGN